MNPELITLFAAMTPFLELKLAIPLGRELGLSIVSALFFAVAGTIIPAILTLILIKPFTDYLRKKSALTDKFFKKLFDKTQKKHKINFQKFGPLFLMLFVAIPLPGSGSVSGALIAFIFGVDFWKAITLITMGTFIAGILVTGGVQSIFALSSVLSI